MESRRPSRGGRAVCFSGRIVRWVAHIVVNMWRFRFTPSPLHPFTLAFVLLLSGCVRHTAHGSGTTIRFWNGFTGPDGKTMEAMVARFQQENPDVHVEMQIIPWAQYYDKLTLSLAIHDAPELFICHIYRMPEFATYRAFRPLDDLQTGRHGLPAADFLPRPWAAAHFQGHLYGVPLDCHPLGLYYNRALFRRAGIVDAQGQARPPTTWQEFLDDAARLTHPPDQWGFAITNRDTNWYTFAEQHGGGVLGPDLRQVLINSPQTIEATQQIRDLVSRYHIAPDPEGTDAWMGFRQGRVAMAMEGIYMLDDLRKTVGLDYGGAPVPSFGPIRATWAGSHLMCMPGTLGARETRAAWRLVKYLSDHSLDWASGGQVPVRRSLQDTARFRTMQVQSEFAKQLPYICYDAPSPKATEIGPFVSAAVEAALLGIQSPRAAMEDAAARINRALARP